MRSGKNGPSRASPKSSKGCSYSLPPGEKHGFPVLGKVPVNSGVRAGGDGGEPLVVIAKAGESVAANALRAASGKLAQRLAVKAFSSLPILD